MREVIVKDSSILGRFIQTIDAFRAEHEKWPTEIEIGREPYELLKEMSLTPDAMKLVEEKLHLILCNGNVYIALDNDGSVSVYNWEYKNEGLSALEWIGIKCGKPE